MCLPPLRSPRFFAIRTAVLHRLRQYVNLTVVFLQANLRGTAVGTAFGVHLPLQRDALCRGTVILTGCIFSAPHVITCGTAIRRGPFPQFLMDFAQFEEAYRLLQAFDQVKEDASKRTRIVG